VAEVGTWCLARLKHDSHSSVVGSRERGMLLVRVYFQSTAEIFSHLIHIIGNTFERFCDL